MNILGIHISTARATERFATDIAMRAISEYHRMTIDAAKAIDIDTEGIGEEIGRRIMKMPEEYPLVAEIVHETIRGLIKEGIVSKLIKKGIVRSHNE